MAVVALLLRTVILEIELLRSLLVVASFFCLLSFGFCVGGNLLCRRQRLERWMQVVVQYACRINGKPSADGGCF